MSDDDAPSPSYIATGTAFADTAYIATNNVRSMHDNTFAETDWPDHLDLVFQTPRGTRAKDIDVQLNAKQASTHLRVRMHACDARLRRCAQAFTASRRLFKAVCLVRSRVTTVFDYRGGFFNQWGFENQRCISGNCRAANDPKAPLADQAAAVTTNSAAKRTVWGFFVPNDFMRR